jgi:hypothetical protein
MKTIGLSTRHSPFWIGVHALPNQHDLPGGLSSVDIEFWGIVSAYLGAPPEPVCLPHLHER